MSETFTIIPGNREGVVSIPPSKSDSQRAILCAGLAKGISILKNVGSSNDEKAMLDSISRLGAQVRFTAGSELVISGMTSQPLEFELNIGESGLACRLLTSVASTFEGKGSIIGAGSILQRPMHFFDEVLPQHNVHFDSKGGKLPFSIKGPLKGGEYSVDGSQSSQYISGLLMALPLAKEPSELNVKGLTSKPYVQMTLNTLKAFGIQIEQQNLEEFIIAGNQHYLATDYTVEGDWSSASYWLVASALGAKIDVQGLTMSSLQADKKILDAFVAAGCRVIHGSDGLSIDGSKRKAFEFDATNCPDLFPALVTFAALTEGQSKIYGLDRLKNKESDRGTALIQEFGELGVEMLIEDNSLVINGKVYIEGGKVSSYNDHRIAMCLAIAGLFAAEPIIVEGAEAVRKSYPEFWDHLNNLKIEL